MGLLDKRGEALARILGITEIHTRPVPPQLVLLPAPGCAVNQAFDVSFTTIYRNLQGEPAKL